jgi:hypothetical protein
LPGEGKLHQHNFFPSASGIMAEVPSSVFSKDSEILVKQSWELLKKDTTTNAVIFFTNIFEIAPAAKDFFPFVKNSTVPYEQNAKLKQHATLVFKMVCCQTQRISSSKLGCKPRQTHPILLVSFLVGVTEECVLVRNRGGILT